MIHMRKLARCKLEEHIYELSLDSSGKCLLSRRLMNEYSHSVEKEKKRS